MSELEVIWSGSHKDTYLCVRDVAQHPLAEARPMQSGTSQARVPVIDVLPFDRARAMTMGELLARTGSTYGSVRRGLWQVNKAGLLASSILPGRHGSGRERKLYWRKAVVAA